jgi:AcrR family transcriptional regulator
VQRTTSAELIVTAARRAIRERGPRKLTLSAVATAAGVSRPTLYRWFPTKADLLEAMRRTEREHFEAGLTQLINDEDSPARRLDAALRYLVTYIDHSASGRDGVIADPEFTLRALNEGFRPFVESMVHLLGDALLEVPAVRYGALTNVAAAELFVRLAFSHILVPAADGDRLFAEMRSLAGLEPLPASSAGRRTARSRRTKAVAVAMS